MDGGVEDSQDGGRGVLFEEGHKGMGAVAGDEEGVVGGGVGEG